MNTLHIFATNVRNYRKQKGLSQEGLAEKSNLHRTYISSLEREKRNISIENIEKIADALSVDAYQLFLPSTAEIKEKKKI